MSGVFGGGGSGGGVKMPSVQAQNPGKRAEPLVNVLDGTERQKKMAASMITKDWAQPTLSQKGLLGL